MGDRIVVMKDGFIKQVGAPLDIYQYPDNMFVAGFIGSPCDELRPRRVAQGRRRLRHGIARASE